MRINQRAQQIESGKKKLINDQNILFGETPPMKKIKKSKNDKQTILMNLQNKL